MANLTESPIYEPGIFQLEKSTPAVGGAPVIDNGVPSAGHANVQGLQLANRTAYLKDQLSDLSNVTDATKGAALVGWDGDTVGAQINLSKKLANYAALENYKGIASRVTITNFMLAGNFTLNTTDTTTLGNGGTKIRDALNRLWERDFLGGVHVEWFGAIPDGVTECQEPIKRANNCGVPLILYGKGSYLVNYYENSGPDYKACILLRNGTTTRGMGVNQTFIKVANAANSNAFMLRDPNYINIEHMTIDGNRANQSMSTETIPPEGNSCCIAVAGRSLRSRFSNLRCREAMDYGIGIEVGYDIGSIYENIWIENTGSDGWDFKNTLSQTISVKISNIEIQNFGLRPTGESFVGIDLRGEFQLSNIRIYNYGGGFTGLRLMPDASDGSYKGGNNCQLSNIYIDGGVAGGIGMSIRGHSNELSNVRIQGGSLGIELTSRDNKLTNVIIRKSGKGMSVRSGIAGFEDAINNTYEGLEISDCTGLGLEFTGSEADFLGARITRNVGNVALSSGATGVLFAGGRISDPSSGANISDPNSLAIFRNVRGVKNEATVNSDQFSIATAQTVTVTIPHGLAFAPQQYACSLNLVTSTAVDDFAIGFIRIVSTDSTNVVVRVRVTVASATAGAVARLALRVSARAY